MINLSGGLAKVNHKSKIVKTNNEYFFHHSLEKDSKGNIYSPIRLKDPVRHARTNDGFAILDKELNVQKIYLLNDIYQKAGLSYSLNLGSPSSNPFHLNDVQPITKQAGTEIVLLSLRSQSSIVAFDLVKEKILWILEGYTNMQHDVDILDEDGTYISIFDNNVDHFGIFKRKYNQLSGNIFTTIKNLPTSSKNLNDEMIIYKYPSTQLFENKLSIEKERFYSLREPFIPKTSSEGLAEYIIKNDSIFIEESNYGRLLEYDLNNKKLLWEYINKNKDKDIYFMMRWSRRIKTIPKETLELLK